MSNKIGHFEILSELAKSPTGVVYKANDAEAGQTVALKAIDLSAFGEHATALEKALVEEVEACKALSSPNVTTLFGAGEIEGKFCASMDYVQGNSIATMLARKEGFSIWDLLDIGRQLCNGLDQASSKNVIHYSLEPAKIMCGWDGTVRILSFGVSSVGKFAHLVSEGLPTILHYMPPEQVSEQPMDLRSNLYSLGAIFYEMVTERKAFEGDDIASLRQSILESTPVPPIQINGKVHPLLSDLIVKALAKDPAQRYQTGREMLDDLEKCKETKSLGAKKPEASKGTMAPQQARAAAQSKFIASANAKPSAPAASKPVAKAPATPAKPVVPATSGLAKPSSLATPSSGLAAPKSALAKPGLAVPKAAAAAAGIGSSTTVTPSAVPKEIPELDLESFSAPAVKTPSDESATPSAYMSSAAVEPEIETFESESEEGPKIAVDPMMAESGPAGSKGTSFSEIAELPPLKEAYVPPPPPPQASYQPVQQEAPRATMFEGDVKAKREEKPKVQPKEVAQKAIKEIKGVPPKLMFYSLAAAGALILAIGIGVTVYIHSLNGDDDTGSSRRTQTPEMTAQPAPEQPAPQKEAAPAAPAPVAAQPAETSEPESAAPQPSASSRSRGAKKRPAPAPVIIPGQLALDSTPQGAQVQVDGQSYSNWITPFTWTNLSPGKHTITVSKPGFSTDTRTVEISSANRTTTVVHLSQLMATLVVKSDPPGANVYVDGRDTGTKTPAQVSVDKGQHVVLVRMMGYIDETMSAQFVLGQTFNFAPTLRALGSVDNMRTVGGKMSKLFGGKGVQAGQATLSIRTQPKGAQIAINQHLVEKMSPADVAVDPGNYVIDITLTGYAPIHKVVTADKGGKVVVDEVMQRE